MFRLTSSALALAAMTAPAFADVTPEQVWQSWVDYYQSVGYSVTEGGRDKSGDRLTLRDVVIATGGESGRMQLTLPQVVLTDLGDGKVKTLFAEELGLDLSGSETEGENYELPVTVRIPGNTITTSGAAADMTHEFDYPTVELTTSTITTNGSESPLPVKFSLSGTSGTFHTVTGSPNRYDYEMVSEAMTFEGDVPDDQNGMVKFAGSLDGLESRGKLSAPGEFTNMEEEMDAALKSGLSIEGSLKAGVAKANFDYSGTDEQGQPTSGTGTYDGKGFDASFNLSRQGMGYKLGSAAAQFQLTSPQVPFPISYGFESGSMDLLLPVSQQDAAQPFKFAYALNGVTMAEEIWKIFDPQALLSRAPASLELDLSGLMKVTRDLFAMPEETLPGTPENPDAAPDAQAPTAAMADAEDSGFEPVEMQINRLALDLLGAKVNATGELKAAADGNIEAPVGQIHAEYEGLNTLLDSLGTIGIVPAEQMMGVRMMLALFAKPVEGTTDRMATDLEFREGGAVFANGQQIR
ncbi:DUF2125 domain-containing protein [Paracoccus ravus]|uniref:DUF2125 domain-containing protein n=1 Tax=Paracoccus ravus TaxID=2447760 RepID=UPI00106E8466|nr:DUF2125 domain-containing protein [Paracoccus ravus]